MTYPWYPLPSSPVPTCKQNGMGPILINQMSRLGIFPLISIEALQFLQFLLTVIDFPLGPLDAFLLTLAQMGHGFGLGCPVVVEVGMKALPRLLAVPLATRLCQPDSRTGAFENVHFLDLYILVPLGLVPDAHLRSSMSLWLTRIRHAVTESRERVHHGPVHDVDEGDQYRYL